MKTTVLLLTVGARIASAETAPSPSLEATLSYETGPAYIAQNDGRYGVTGTRYDADTVGQRDNLLVLYRLVERGPVALEVGGSLQIRNAEVAFVSLDGAQRAAENDIGLVFAAKTRLWYRPAPDAWWAAFDADAFSTFGLVPGVRGAIYDTQLAAGHPVANGIDLVFGARLLGGGAKVESRHIYNWANFVALTAGVRIALDEL